MKLRFEDLIINNAFISQNGKRSYKYIVVKTIEHIL